MEVYIGRIENKVRVSTSIDCLPPDAQEVKIVNGEYKAIVSDLLGKGFEVEED